MHKVLVTLANLIAFGALAAVVAYWGWRWLGPEPVHVPRPAIDDPVAALAVSPPFGRGGAVAEAPPAPAARSDTRLLGVFAERDGKGQALFRLADGSARLASAGEALTSDATLVAVRPDGVTIRERGSERAIVLRAATPDKAPEVNRAATKMAAACTIPAGFKGPVVRLNAELVAGLISQPQALRAVADAQEGALVIRDSSGFAAMLGMQKGDRVAQANGIALRAPEDVAVAVLRPLAANQQVRLVGTRGGERREVLVLNAGVCPG